MMMKRRLRGGSVAHLFLAALCVAGGLSLPGHSRTAGAAAAEAGAEFILFERGGEIWKMNPDGSNQTTLSGPGVNAAEPQLSPDGTRIAFTCGTELWSVCVMDADGGNVQELTHLRGDTQPAWSPDGTRIAFVGSVEEGTEIYVSNADGSGAATRVTFAVGLKNNPAWSPEGTSIVYDSFEAIHAVNVASGVISTLATGDEAQQPAYSPDGGRIVFYRKTLIRDEEGTVIGKEDGVYVMQADGTNVQSLNAAGGYAPHWGSVKTTPPPAKTPAERVADLISLVRSFNLPYGTTNSLTVKLRGALDALEAGDTATACARLSDFVNHTRAQSGKKLTTAQANQLIEEANAIRSLLGCS